MKTSTAFTSALFAAAAVAQPGLNKRGHGHLHKYNFARDAAPLVEEHHHAKRNIVTQVEWVYEVQTVTAVIHSEGTSYITGDAQPTEVPQTKEGGVFKEKSSTKEAAQPQPEPTQEAYQPPPAAAAPKEKKPSPKPKVQKPKEEPKPEPEPEPTSTSSTSTYEAPAQPTYEAPAQPTYEAPEQPAEKPSTDKPSSGGGSSGSGTSGDLTWYDLGMGSCGIDVTGQDSSEGIVAMPKDFMMKYDNGNPNKNPMCGKTITIKVGGKTSKAKITDTCMGCDASSIDVSKKVFLDLTKSLGDGRINCEWSLDN